MRRVALVAVLASLLLVTGALGAGASGSYRHRDFYSLWTGARLVAAGIDPYDVVRWCQETTGVSVDATTTSGEVICKNRYEYPLWTALLLVPVGVLPLEWAAALWLSTSVALMLGAAALAWRATGGSRRAAPLFAAIVFASQPFWLLVAGGQISSLLAFGMALSAYAAATRREALSGAAFVFAAFKPHIPVFAVAAAIAQALWRDARRFLLSGALGLLTLLAISLAVRPAWIGEWLRELFGREIGHAIEYTTAWGIGAHDLGSLVAGGVIALVLAIGCLWLARRALRERVTLLALTLPLSLFATPYAWSYDFVVLILPWAFVLARSERLPPGQGRPLRFALMLVASPLGWILYILAFSRETETLSALIPALTALLVALAARATERTSPAATTS